MKNTIIMSILFFVLSCLIACSKTSSDKMYIANYVMFDSTIRNNGIITIDTNYSTSYVVAISLDSNTNQLHFRNANYSLQAGFTNTFGSFPSDIIVLTKDSIAVSYASPAVVGGNRFIILKGRKQ